jgi:hypothetical protein
MQLLLPFMTVDPVVTTIEEIQDNIAVVRLMGSSGTFRVEMGKDDRSSLYQLAWDLDAFVWTKEAHQYLQDSLKEENQPRCQICGAIATDFIDCSCGNYAWCRECEGEPGGPTYTATDPNGGPDHEERMSFYSLMWDHADHDCFPECCAAGHLYPRVTAEELAAIVRHNVSKDELFFLEDEASNDDRVVFHVKVRWKSPEEYVYEADRLRARFQLDKARYVEQFRSEPEKKFIELFLPQNP